MVWRGEGGGLTFAFGHGASRRFVKFAPRGSPVDLEHERRRLLWACPYVTVPTVVERGGDEQGTWLVTRALAGENAVAPRWVADPARAVAAIGAGLRAFHDALPVAGCPFSWSVEARLDDGDRRVGRGELRPERWHAEHRDLDVGAALAVLAEPPAVDRMVVCHGDACAPNTLIGDDGGCAGHVDLGGLGVADRWADLAIATWSAGWNYGAGWERALLDAYGVAPDELRTRYYRLLYDLSA